MSAHRTLVWDLPIRAFHWSLGLAVAGSFLTVKLGWMEWHGRLGGLVLSLLLFRVWWGILGSHTARFSQFWPSLSRIKAYLGSAKDQPVMGHNPLGALAVFALLGVFLLQALAGLATSDEIAYDGPLVAKLPSSWVEWAGWLHQTLEPALLALVVLHVAAIVYYRVKKGVNLVRPMVTGYAELPLQPDDAQVRDTTGRRLMAAVLFLLSGALVSLLFL
ncbi:MAG: putative Ni/Fe-hydrogenase 1 B-type cytochrome subunit [Pseudomonadota bacterium]